VSEPLRVLIVDDSATHRTALSQVLGRIEGLEVISTARDGLDAVKQVQSLRPDVVLMDVRMPKLDGLEATRRIMADSPTPILLMTASDNLEADAGVALRALEYGALDLIPKPERILEPGSVDRLADQLRLLALVPVISNPRGLKARRELRAESGRARSPSPSDSGPTTTYYRRASRVVGIAASTGGPRALKTLLSSLPPTLNAAVVVVQHIDPAFEESLVRWLNEECAIRVTLAEQGQDLHSGTVYFAPQGSFLEVTERRRVELITEPVSPAEHCPSGDRLFQSLAKSYATRALAVILTGMGRDGATGMLDVQSRGGLTIAQDEETSTIYGMPAAAAKNGAAGRILPLEDIGPAIVSDLG